MDFFLSPLLSGETTERDCPVSSALLVSFEHCTRLSRERLCFLSSPISPFFFYPQDFLFFVFESSIESESFDPVRVFLLTS